MAGHTSTMTSLAMTFLLAASAGSARAGADEAAGADSLLAGFPIEFEVAPGNRLYVYGCAIASVRLTTAVSDTLYLNGIPILPSRSAPPDSSIPERVLKEVYGSVPFVQDLVAHGASHAAAVVEYNQEREALVDSLRVAYVVALREGHQRETAGAVALSRLAEFDRRDLVDPELSCSPGWNFVNLHWNGMPFGPEEIALGPLELLVSRNPRMPSDGEKLSRARELEALLVHDSPPCWYLFVSGGTATLRGEDAVAEAESQTRRFREEGLPEPGPLSRVELEQILKCEGRLR